jgi:hypothetical protein
MNGMRRRELLAALPCAALAAQSKAPPVQQEMPFTAFAETMFLDILRGFVKNAANTSDSYAVVEYPDATVTQSFLAKSGLSATGVTRMLPAIASWIVSRRQPGILHIDGKQHDLLDVAGSAIVNGTNPDHQDYWGASPSDAQNQRQVESSIVAWTAWLLRDTLLPQMNTVERRRLDEWLASCTRREVRRNNWAWFTAVNIAARMALKDKFDEFTFDQNFMFDDLRALDGMYVGKGWYNDDKPRHAFDYYNAWVFASHFLYWNAMVGERFPEWSQMFASRLKDYLDTSPFFFGSNGSHVLYGRSLIYRFGVFTPLVLAYTQKQWPHAPALLQRIVRGNLEFHRATNGFDPAKGKLRETYSEKGTVDVHESYIDGGHPYWGMQAFAMWLIPREDPFWSGDSASLPVERTGFVQPLEGPGMVLVGHRGSGQVKLLQGRSTKTDFHYRDKYNKLIYSTHFPFNIVQRAEISPWDNALVLRDTRRRRSAGRGDIEESRILPDGIEISYPLSYGGLKLSVRTTVFADGEFEARIHRVIAPAEIDEGMELAEGSSALGMESYDHADNTSQDRFSLVRNRLTGMLIGSWIGSGWIGLGAAADFGTSDSAASNIIYPLMQVNTLWAPLKPGAQILTSIHYASPKPLAHAALHATAQKLLAKIMPKPAAAPPKRG